MIRQISIGAAGSRLLLEQLRESERRVVRIPIQGTRPSDYEAASRVTDAAIAYAIEVIKDVVGPLEENGPGMDLDYFVHSLEDVKHDLRSTLQARAEGKE